METYKHHLLEDTDDDCDLISVSTFDEHERLIDYQRKDPFRLCSLFVMIIFGFLSIALCLMVFQNEAFHVSILASVALVIYFIVSMTALHFFVKMFRKIEQEEPIVDV